MTTKVLLLTIGAVLISFAVGFLIANALNRRDLNDLRAENERLQNEQTTAKSEIAENALSDDEIAKKIASADQNPDNFDYQKNLALALYRYASVKQDAKLLQEVLRLLTRAHRLNVKDYEVIVALGNVNFDSALLGKDNEKFRQAREFYQNALEQKANDVDVRTDLGLTYFLENPPETDRAIAEFQKSLQVDKKHEKTLQVLTEALVSENRVEDAEKYFDHLKQVNQNNEALTELSAKIAQSKSATKQ